MSYRFESYSGLVFDLKSMNAIDAVNEADFMIKVCELDGGFVYEDSDQGTLLVEIM